jgi:hypothetical protein
MLKEEEKFHLSSLYDTVSRIYLTKTPVSRLIYIVTMKESDRTVKENLREEIKRKLSKNGKNFNLVLIYIGNLYALVGIESSNETIFSFLSVLLEEIKSKKSFHAAVNIITYVEECPVSVFPVFYKYEMTNIAKESQLYKDKPVTEKVKIIQNLGLGYVF